MIPIVAGKTSAISIAGFNVTALSLDTILLHDLNIIVIVRKEFCPRQHRDRTLLSLSARVPLSAPDLNYLNNTVIVCLYRDSGDTWLTRKSDSINTI